MIWIILSMKQYVAVSCSVSQLVAVCCSVLQCVAACCSVLQCIWCVSSIICCSYIHEKRPTTIWKETYVCVPKAAVSNASTHSLQKAPVYLWTETRTRKMTCVCVHNTLQHAATRCNTLQHTATHCNTHRDVCPYAQHTATHCNMLQHAATRCYTLQSIKRLETCVCVQEAAVLNAGIQITSKETYVSTKRDPCKYANRLL